MIPVMDKSIDIIGIAGAVIAAAECIILLAAIYPVERALKKNFDKNGNRR